MKATPHGWPPISSAANYRDAARMIDWLSDAYGFEGRLKVEGDNESIVHSELTYGEGLIMVSRERTGKDAERFGVEMKSTLSAGCVTQSMMVFVDDADAHCERARAAGARITQEPAVHDYGASHLR